TLKKVADAVDPLYKSLSDGQKRRFAMLEHMLAPRDGGQAGPQGRDFRGRQGFDRGPDGGRDRDGQRRSEGGPRRTDFSPQGPAAGSEQKL
ncbi:MAG TPA: hypothetical protein VG291_20770, partial [Xanthobacteraceae bacterium]|nr:hypothetical protein [Xanthobacteraceae bacterium]